MTRKYWVGIFLGMLAIFAAGMLVARGVNRAATLVEDNLPSPLRLMMNTGFKVDGDRIGDIQRLQFMRSNPGQFDSAVISVKIDDSADVRRIGACTLRATNAHPFSSSTRFICTSHSDSARLNLVPFGHIVVLPEGKPVTFYVASSTEQEMRQNAYRGTGSSDSGDVDINATDGNFRITVNGREIVSANGDSAGGSLIIRDGSGHPIVQISGDSSGGSVRVTDANGKKVVDIHGTGSKKKP
jgi:hypothetical protein